MTSVVAETRQVLYRNAFKERFKKSSDASDDDQQMPTLKEVSSGMFSKRYASVHHLGNGGNGYVYLVADVMTGRKAVAKFIPKRAVPKWIRGSISNLSGRCPLEIWMMHMLRQEAGIVTLREAFENDSYYQVVMEMKGNKGCDLERLVTRTPLGRLSEPEAAYIFRQVASTVRRLHRHGILHRDIKPTNLIVYEDYNVEIIDFGAARQMHDGSRTKVFNATKRFRSPEVWKEQEALKKGESTASDCVGTEPEVWALGLTICFTVFGSYPFPSDESICDPNFAIKFPSHASAELKILLTGMLHRDPASRFTIDHVLQSEWMRQAVNNKKKV